MRQEAWQMESVATVACLRISLGSMKEARGTKSRGFNVASCLQNVYTLASVLRKRLK